MCFYSVLYIIILYYVFLSNTLHCITLHHPYHCKKGIPYSQTLRLNSICSDSRFFDRRCNDVMTWKDGY